MLLSPNLWISRDRHATGWLAVGAVALAAFSVLQDDSRLQPWFYQYSFMLAACCLFWLGRREQAGDPEPVLWLDGRPEIISGERSIELYSCDDILP